MSGHSKWATTKHKKAAVDARRGKLFAKLIKNVEVAARTGGGDPVGNPTLYDAVQKAKKSSVPNENIDRAIRRGAGLEAGGAQYETITYEGYAPGGVAVLVECLTDNRNRAAADVIRPQASADIATRLLALEVEIDAEHAHATTRLERTCVRERHYRPEPTATFRPCGVSPRGR